ncbi:MAG: hypothetical protein C4550_06205 [Nitrospiraceae bacterium]|nr:MAG: hypothetical protein C4550_06205 [Nitrospiraceae bacterium]
MNKKISFFFSIIFIAVIISHAFAENESRDNLYRNDEYQFRIKFPVGWKIKEGDGKRIVKKAVDTKNLSSLIISAAKLPGNIDIKDFSQKELDEFLRDSIEEIKSKYSDVKIIEQGIRYLDNKKAAYLKYSFSYKTLDKTINLVTVQYTTLYKGKYYSIGGGAPVPIFNAQEGIINKSIASFVFEVHHDVESLSKNELITYRDDTYKFFFQYPKTWTAVPSTHKGTRIKIVNEYGSGDADCGVNVQFDASLKNVTPKDVIATISNPQILQKAMRTAIPDATIVKSGRTYLSNQEAFYAITKFTFRSFDVEVPMKMIQMQTAKSGYVYTFSCRTSSERFDEMIPIFQLISAGFVIKP